MPIGNPIRKQNESRIISVLATEGQSVFTVEGGYIINQISVFRNGVRLSNSEDFTAGDGSTVTLNNEANVDDRIEFHIFDRFTVQNAIVGAASSQTISGDVVINGKIFGNLQVSNVNTGIVTTTQLDLNGKGDISSDLTIGRHLSVAGVSTFQAVQGTTGTFSSDVSAATLTSTGDVTIPDSIIHTGDTNTKIRFPAADTITAETGGTERFRIADAASTFTNKLIIDDGSNGHLFLQNTSSDNTIRSGTTGFAAYKNFVLNASQHIFKLSNTEKVRITSAGSIGIGTASAAQDIHLQQTSATVRIESTGDATSARLEILGKNNSYSGLHLGDIDDVDVGGIRYYNNDNIMYFRTSGANRLSINSSGKVLIGDDTAENTMGLNANVQTFGTDASTSGVAIKRGSNDAQAAFLVLSKSRNTSVGSRTILQNGDEVGNIFFVADDGTDLISNTAAIKSQIDAAPGANDTPGNLTFWTTADGANSASERMRINSSGVITLGNISNTVLQASVCNSVSGHQFISQCDDNNNGFEVYQKHGSTSTRNTLAVYANTGNSSAKKLQFSVRGDGNVGINPDASGPDRLLHVSDSNQAGVVTPFRLTNVTGQAGTEVRMEFECGVDEIAYIGAKNEGSDIGPLMFATASSQGAYPTEKVRIPATTWGLLVTNLASTGSTGGYQTDGASLRYNADSTFCCDGGAAVTFTRKSSAGKVIDFYNGTSYAGGIYVNGTNNTALQQGSDYRLKTDITSMTDGINKVKQLNPIYYKSKEGLDTTTVQNGFLAHEVQSVLPTLVDGEKDAPIDEKGKGYQTLNYAGFTPTAIAAIKELIAKVETLEVQVRALQGD